MIRKPLLPLFAAAVIGLLGGVPAPTAQAHDPADAMTERAADWLNSLSPELRDKATYKIDDEKRVDWHFIPKPFEGEGARKGVTIKEMRADQRALALALLNTGLSHRGFGEAMVVMSLEQVLHELENNAPKRDPAMYYVSIYGKPGSKAWGWAFEGHHLSLNFTIIDGVVSGTPNFYASNPGVVLEGARKGLQTLPGEENVARDLARSLDKDQLKKAMIADKAPRDILTSAEPTVKHLGDAGLPASDLNETQKQLLRELIDVYVRRLRPELADEALLEIEEAGFDKIVLAWAGGVEKGEQTYYRVQGPTFLLEYANTQNDANHVHAVWRDFDGDFGRDLLKEHFKKAH